MPIINDTTTNYTWPLPHASNALSDDVARLRTALSGVDTTVKTLTDNVASGAQSLTNKTLVAPVITNYTETMYSGSATSLTVNLANGTIQKLTTTGNATITLPASVAGKSYTVIVKYGGTHTLTWTGGSTLKWPANTAPAPTSVNGKIDIFSFLCDGTSTFGFCVGKNF